MEFPTITLPELPQMLTDFIGTLIQKIPFEVPALLHPPLVHFAIVLPVIIVLLELFNVFAKMTSTPEAPKGKTVSALSFFMIILFVVVAIGAYVTGSVDGKNTWDMLSEAGQADLKAHKLLGTYIVLASILLLIFKFIALIGPKTRILFLVLAIAFTATSFKQGKEGGELVYVHGANVQKAKELDDKLFDVQDQLDTLKAESNASKQSGVVVETTLSTLKVEKEAVSADIKRISAELEATKAASKAEKEALAANVKSLSEELQIAKTVGKDLEVKANAAIEATKKSADDMIAKVKAEAAAEIAAAKTSVVATETVAPVVAPATE